MMLHPVCIPMFEDNYLWLLSAENGATLAVDVGDYALLADYLHRHKLTLNAVLITHRHPDHIAGLPTLHAKHPHVPIYGHPLINGITQPLYGGEILDLAELGRFLVMDVTGHTRQHLAYYQLQEQILFCGDTLFSAGCGRIFDGDAYDFHHSLEKIKLLPDNTRICPAHEYTLANLEFALALEPDNHHTRKYQDWCKQQRADSLPTLPTLLSSEKQHNPFLRCHILRERMQALTQQAFFADNQVFKAMRQYKDHWRPV